MEENGSTALVAGRAGTAALDAGWRRAAGRGRGRDAGAAALGLRDDGTVGRRGLGAGGLAALGSCLGSWGRRVGPSGGRERERGVPVAAWPVPCR